MKKKILVPLLGAVVLGLGVYFGYHTYDAYAGTNESDLLLANAEALATSEGASDDCHYSNGYTWFTSKNGGAYDCCKVWVNKKPGDEHCR